MGTDVTNIALRGSQNWNRSSHPSTKYHGLAELRKLRECEQVAAICYRVRGGVIEFLLVRTRGGRWIFPKGNAEPGLTHAQAAALEAFEEAGVHGRMEEACFTSYTRRKGDSRNSSAGSPGNTVTVDTHLCEVLRLERPRERGRNPTWFSIERAKNRLLADRSPAYGAELTSVIDHAVARIQHLGGGRRIADGTIRRVQFIDAR